MHNVYACFPSTLALELRKGAAVNVLHTTTGGSPFWVLFGASQDFGTLAVGSSH